MYPELVKDWIERHLVFDFNDIRTKNPDMTIDLSGQNFRNSGLSRINLDGANLQGACFDLTWLQSASFVGANLKDATFQNARLENAKFSHAPFTPKEWLARHFLMAEDGRFVVYKAVGETHYPPPRHWVFKAGSILDATVDQNALNPCSYGVNFATLEWIEDEFSSYIYSIFSSVKVWECLVHPNDVVVPFASDGKARASKLTLVRIIDMKE